MWISQKYAELDEQQDSVQGLQISFRLGGMAHHKLITCVYKQIDGILSIIIDDSGMW